ncbi:MAG: outer membrane beta-barrel protein [Planctomycetes bacterium]|nr:outer membrane beta-barrel protein [Planctomycetota bacterium]
MNLRYVVPALGIIAFSNPAFAADSGVTIGGFVDTIFGVGVRDADDAYEAFRAGPPAVPSNTGARPLTGDNDTSANFSAASEIRLGYKVGDAVGAQVDVEYNNNGTDTSTGSHSDVYLEQAYVNWAFADAISLTTGKFTTYAGWVAADADGLYRISSGPIVALYGGELVGAALNWSPSEELGVSFFLVNGLDILNEDSTNTNQDDERFAPAVDVVYKAKDIGTFNAELGYENSVNDVDFFSLGVNATITAVENLTLGFEVIYQDISDENGVGLLGADASRLGLLAMANFAMKEMAVPMSVTGMIQHVNAEIDDAADTSETSTELALALLTNPTGDAKFGVNAELSYQMDTVDAGTEIENNSIGFALEAIAVIP